MRRIKPIEVLFLFALFSVINSGIFSLEQEDINRQNIIKDLRSLLGLDLHHNDTQTTKIPIGNINEYTSSISPFYTPTTSSTTPTSNGVVTPQAANNQTINNNETFIANTSISNTSVANLTTNDIITDLTNDSNITSNVNVTNTNHTDIINPVDIFNISQIPESTNTSFGSSNLTRLDPSAFFTTPEPANSTRDEIITEDEAMITAISSSSQRPVYPTNEPVQEFPSQQNKTGSTLLPDNSTSNAHCSVMPKFTDICLLSNEYRNQTDSLTTFAEVAEVLSNSYVQSCLQKYCYDGEWCLGDSMDAIINNTLNIPAKFCSSPFLSCLRSTVDEYRSCANHKKFKVISDSLELVCKYRLVTKDDKRAESCGFHLVKLISVLLDNFEQNNLDTSNTGFSCFSQKGYLMVSFNCLLTQCPEMFVLILNEFESWKWFTENRSMSYSCPAYYECASSSSSSTTFWRRLSTTTRTEYNMWRSTTAKMGQNYETLTTRNEVIDSFNKEIENEENLPSGSHPFGSAVTENTHIMASLSAMIVILTIGMSVLMVVCWRHLKKYSSRKRKGYSKLKTGEC